MPILSAKYDTSSIEWDIKIIIFSSNLSVLRIFQIFCREATSTPPVGSSKIITRLLPQQAIAIHNFLFCPPLKSFAKQCFVFSSLKSNFFNKYFTSSSISSFTFFNLSFLTYLSKQNISKFSWTVKSLNNILLFWGQIPNIFLNWLLPFFSRISYPLSLKSFLYIILPPLASIKPPIIEIKVLFPAPFSPKRAKISFSYMVQSKSFKTIFSPLL